MEKRGFSSFITINVTELIYGNGKGHAAFAPFAIARICFTGKYTIINDQQSAKRHRVCKVHVHRNPTAHDLPSLSSHQSWCLRWLKIAHLAGTRHTSASSHPPATAAHSASPITAGGPGMPPCPSMVKPLPLAHSQSRSYKSRTPMKWIAESGRLGTREAGPTR